MRCCWDCVPAPMRSGSRPCTSWRRGLIFPHNIGLGCANDRKLVEKIERVTAEEVRATGINWAFAPCVTVPRDERWGRTYEGYSENPKIVKNLGRAAVRGFQGANLSELVSVAACAKHFIGDGGTTYGTSTKNDRSRIFSRATTPGCWMTRRIPM